MRTLISATLALRVISFYINFLSLATACPVSDYPWLDNPCRTGSGQITYPNRQLASPLSHLPTLSNKLIYTEPLFCSLFDG